MILEIMDLSKKNKKIFIVKNKQEIDNLIKLAKPYIGVGAEFRHGGLHDALPCVLQSPEKKSSVATHLLSTFSAPSALASSSPQLSSQQKSNVPLPR